MRTDGFAPPSDPRDGWDLPAPGEMPVVSHLGDLVTRVLAPNPSPMTLDGTNTYVVAPAGSGEAAVVDPGPDDSAHLARVEAVLAERDAEVRVVLVTHHHRDHAEAATTWARKFGCPIVSATAIISGTEGRIVDDGDRVAVGDLLLEVVATPGHTRDHIALRLPSGALMTGDHVLGRGTSFVAYPDGDLAAYLESLRRVLELESDQLLPGHGPDLCEDPQAVIEYYRDHRAFREQQVLAILTRGPATTSQLVKTIYADIDQRLWGAAEASTRATLAFLRERDRISIAWDDRARLVDEVGLGPS